MKRWATKPLGELCDVEGGNAAPQGDENFKEGTIPFVRMKDLGRYHLTNNLTQTDDKLTETSAANNRMKLFNPGCILFPRSGSVALNHRAILGVRAFVVSHIGVLQNLRPEITAGYLYLYLTTFDMTALAKKTTGVDSLAFADVKRIPVPVPPIAEQEWIVNLLDEADELRKLRAKADRRTAAFIPAVYYEMFGDPTINSESWSLARLGDIAPLKSGYAFKSTDYRLEGIRLVRISNLDGQNLVFDKSTAYLPDSYLDAYHASRLEADDVLIAMSGATTGKLGIVRPFDVPSLLNQRVGKFFIRDKNRLEPKFLFWTLSFPAVIRKLIGEAAGSAQSNVSPSDVGRVDIPVPPLSLQKEFATRVTEIRALQTEQAASRLRLEALFQSFLHHAFNGEP
jgi:type I restriction enzyme S subunit